MKIILPNEKREWIKRKEIKYKSPIKTKLSPKISPKLKNKIKVDKKDKKIDKNEVRSIKDDKKCINSPSIMKKSRLVKELIGSFEASNKIDKTHDKNVVSEGAKKDASGVLMDGMVGDTLIKKTPTRKKIKRLEKVTSASRSLMENWVKKSSHKGHNGNY